MVTFPDDSYAADVGSAVIEQAIDDWKALCRKRVGGSRYPVIKQEDVIVHFRELQRFFHETARILLADKDYMYQPMMRMLYSIPGAPRTYMSYDTTPEKLPESPWKGDKAIEGVGYAQRAVEPLLEKQKREMAARRAQTGL